MTDERRCRQAGCDTILSMYNTDIYCWAHEEVAYPDEVLDPNRLVRRCQAVDCELPLGPRQAKWCSVPCGSRENQRRYRLRKSRELAEYNAKHRKVCQFPSCEKLVPPRTFGSSGNNKRYCSERCRDKYWMWRRRKDRSRPPMGPRPCAECGEEFTSGPKARHKKYCSRSCGRKHRRKMEHMSP